LHTNTAMPLASCGSSLPPGKSLVTNSSSTIPSSPSASLSSSSAAKQFLTRRVRSHSKSDTQSVSDKSLFSRFFPKKAKKPTATLLTMTTKSIDLTMKNKRAPLTNQASLSSNDHRLTIDEEEEEHQQQQQQQQRHQQQQQQQLQDNANDDDDDELDERKISTGSLSDADRHRQKKDGMSSIRSSNTSRFGSRSNSGNSKVSTSGPNSLILPTSDSQYYASMSSAPTGFSISYHKCMKNGNDNLRKQAALGRLQQQQQQQQQQQNKQTGGTSSSGASQLMVGCFGVLDKDSLCRCLAHILFT
jgi:hypothetical protein